MTLSSAPRWGGLVQWSRDGLTEGVVVSSVVSTSTDDIVDLARRLIAEYPAVPASRVLRCLSEAHRRAQSWGCPPQHLATTVEASTRWGIAQAHPGR